MKPVHNVSIHGCCTHWWCSHFCVVTSILCHPSRYSYCCLKTSEMITLEKHDHSSGGLEKSATKSWVWVECQHFEWTFQNSATQARLDSYNRIRSKGAHCSFEGYGVPEHAAVWEGGWVASVGLCGAVWGCVGHAAGGGNRIARAKGGLGEASRETLLQDAQKCSPTHETMAIGILSLSKRQNPQWTFPHRNGSDNLTTCNKPICKLRAHEYHRKWRWYDQSFYFDDSPIIDLHSFISSWLSLARDEQPFYSSGIKKGYSKTKYRFQMFQENINIHISRKYWFSYINISNNMEPLEDTCISEQ